MPIQEPVGLFANIGRKIMGAVRMHHNQILWPKPLLDRLHAVIYARDFEVIIMQRRVDEDRAWRNRSENIRKIPRHFGRRIMVALAKQRHVAFFLGSSPKTVIAVKGV
jgi:hypothetical protein